MQSLDRYIFRQCLTPLTATIIVVTLIVWITQSLQRIEIIVENGQGFGVFAFLSILIIPSLLAIIVPFAVFGATLYAVYRLHTDSEIAVMFAAGVSRRRIAAPVLLLAAIGAGATLYINVDLMPRCYRVLKERVADIRADIVSSVIRSGEFTKLLDGFTIYVEETYPGGVFTGMLVNDYRDAADPRIYMAERAAIKDTSLGPVLVLADGNVQRTDEAGVVNIIEFNRFSINVDPLMAKRGELTLELTERYPHELLNPDMSKAYDRANAGVLIAEGHARYANPLYTFAFVLVGLYALIGGAYSRRGYLARVAIAGAVALTIRVIGFVLQNYVATSGTYWLLYAVPIIAIMVLAWLLFAASSLDEQNGSQRTVKVAI